MSPIDIAKLVLQLGLFLADSMGHSNDELKAELAGLLGQPSGAKVSWEAWLEEKKRLSQ